MRRGNENLVACSVYLGPGAMLGALVGVPLINTHSLEGWEALGSFLGTTIGGSLISFLIITLLVKNSIEKDRQCKQV